MKHFCVTVAEPFWVTVIEYFWVAVVEHFWVTAVEHFLNFFEFLNSLSIKYSILEYLKFFTRATKEQIFV